MRHPKPSPEQNAGRLVRRAADVLEDRNWIQGFVGSAEHGMCVRGALAFTAHGNAAVSKTEHDAYQAEVYFTRWLLKLGLVDTLFYGGHVDHYMEAPVSFVPNWNDADGRSKEEVLQYMRKFADEVDPQLK